MFLINIVVKFALQNYLRNEGTDGLIARDMACADNLNIIRMMKQMTMSMMTLMMSMMIVMIMTMIRMMMKLNIMVPIQAQQTMW